MMEKNPEFRFFAEQPDFVEKIMTKETISALSHTCDKGWNFSMGGNNFSILSGYLNHNFDEFVSDNIMLYYFGIGKNYDKELSEMREMGFTDEAANFAALKKTNGKLFEAVDYVAYKS